MAQVSDGRCFNITTLTFLQLSESISESLVPFDATSETPLEEQKTEAMVRVQDCLLARTGPEALGLLRAARSVRRSIITVICQHLDLH